MQPGCLKHSYHLIFMDLNMPKLDGIEATKKILKFQKENPEFDC